MRGASLFNELFTDELPEIPKQEGKGRSQDLNTRRDELVLYRFYFYANFTPYRYDLIMDNMSAEFFLSVRRIQDIMSLNAAALRRMKQSRPSVHLMKDTYPHFVWRPVAKPVQKAIPIEL